MRERRGWGGAPREKLTSISSHPLVFASVSNRKLIKICANSQTRTLTSAGDTNEPKQQGTAGGCALRYAGQGLCQTPQRYLPIYVPLRCLVPSVGRWSVFPCLTRARQ